MVANCEQVWREISSYLDGEVDVGLRAAIDEHLGTCARCKAVLEGMRNVVRLYRDERMIDVPAGFGGRLERRLAHSVRLPSRGWSTWSAWLVPVAALILIAGGIEIASSRTVSHPLLSAHAQPAHNLPPDMIVVVSADAKEFHAPGCPFIHNKDRERTLTAQEATRQGYVPCVRCMRKYLETASAGQRAVELETDTYAGVDETTEN